MGKWACPWSPKEKVQSESVYCLYYQKLILLCYQKMQSDFDETLSEVFFHLFELRVNMDRFENNFTRGILSIN